MKYKYCKDVTFEGDKGAIQESIRNYFTLDNIRVGQGGLYLGLEEFNVCTTELVDIKIALDTMCKSALMKFDRWLRDNTKVILGVRLPKKDLQKKLEGYDIRTLADGSINLLDTGVPGATLTRDQIKQILINQIINCADA
jgi:hypothetical protein